MSKGRAREDFCEKKKRKRGSPGGGGAITIGQTVFWKLRFEKRKSKREFL